MTNAEMAKRLQIAEKTIYNWQKNRKELYKIVECALKNNFKSEGSVVDEELLRLISELDEKEKNMYIHEIKARVLRRELNS
ncbi:MAG: hypothetical protein ACK5LP_05580 [Campylobacteraceae bacterium]